MSADPSVDRRLDAWLDLMPSEAPDRVIEAVLLAAETMPQVRRPILRAPWRSTRMNRILLIAAVGVLGAAVLGGALLVAGSRPVTPPPSPVASPAAAATAAPGTVTAPPVPALAPLPEAVQGLWLADGPTPAPGDPAARVQLTGATNGSGAWVTEGGSARLRSRSLESGAADELLLRLERAAGDCPADALGRYRWTVTEGGLRLQLELVEDACAARAEAFARTWTHSHVGLSAGGPGVITGVGPLVQVALPAGEYATRPLIDAQEVYDEAQDLLFYAFRDPQAFADPCSTEERIPWEAGAQAFVDALARNPAMEEVVTTPMEIGGFPALRVTTGARADYPACTPEPHPFYQWVPKADPNGSWWLEAGAPDEFYLVDHPDATLLLQVLPVGSPLTAGIIGSVAFPEGLAPQP